MILFWIIICLLGVISTTLLLYCSLKELEYGFKITLGDIAIGISVFSWLTLVIALIMFFC